MTNTKDAQLLITSITFNDGQRDILCETYFPDANGTSVEHFVNGRRVGVDSYDRIISTLQTRFIDEIAEALDPDNDHGLVNKLDDIRCSLTENEKGEHPISVVGAIYDLTTAISNRD